jgi:putative tricarboxylic transport membrane protein
MAGRVEPHSRRSSRLALLVDHFGKVKAATTARSAARRNAKALRGTHYGRNLIRNPQDFYGGLALAAIALFALWASSDLSGMRGFSFGAATAPRLFAVMLGLTGAVVALIGLIVPGPALERYAIRGPLLVTASILFFAVAIRPLGLIITSFICIMISAAASPEVKWGQSIVWAAILTVFCSLLFVYGLKLPLQLWPNL